MKNKNINKKNIVLS